MGPTSIVIVNHLFGGNVTSFDHLIIVANSRAAREKCIGTVTNYAVTDLISKGVVENGRSVHVVDNGILANAGMRGGSCLKTCSGRVAIVPRNSRARSFFN